MKGKTINQTIVCTGILTVLIASVITTINGKGVVGLFAHSAQLEILYDSCIPEPYTDPNNIGDSEDEKWYLLDDGSETRHIGHSNNATEIKYYFYESSKDGTISWSSIITDSARREYVKNAFVNSICKWNNTFFYKQEGSNIISKHKIVNMLEGTSSNNNIAVYPYTSSQSKAYGITGPSPLCISEYIDTYQGIAHYHRDKWEINFNLSYHIAYSNDSEFILSRTGAHEFGHVLGIVDIDGCENSSYSDYHHEEILMGYSSGGVTTRQPNITYKDLVGAAITRGLHTDNDHQWIFHSYSNNEYKLICSICNGVKYVSSLDGISYVNYKDCDDEHDLEDGNMFAVASYGNSDYYKCKYCRYVAPFTAIEDQDYDYDEYNNAQHIVTNQVQGLEYSFYEDHTFDVTHTCILCGFQCSHAYTYHYENYSSTLHKAYCECGTYDLAPHAANIMNSYFYNGHIYAPCLFCGTLIDLGGNGPIVPGQGFNGQMVTDNGSYIMSNGIYVIVEEDLESYLNGTLIFHPYGEITE